MKQAAKNSNSRFDEARQNLAEAAMWFSELQRAIDGCKAIRSALQRDGDNRLLMSALHCSEFHLDDAANSLDCALEKACDVLSLNYPASSAAGDPIHKAVAGVMEVYA